MTGYEMGGALVFLGFLFLGLVVIYVLSPTRVRQYRRSLADLYVSAKIRVLAKKDDLDLTAEYESFKNWLKKRRLEDLSLDGAIAEELKDEITDEMKFEYKEKE